MSTLKRLVIFLMLLITIVSACSCGSESARTTLNYERPITTLLRSIKAMDSASYLNCYTDGAKQAYMESDNYNPDIVDTMLPSQADNKRFFSAVVVSSKALDDNAIKDLEKDYKDRYKKRISVSKAQLLTVEFGASQGNKDLKDTKDLTVVRVENEWYIYGDVIEKFDFSAS